MGGAETGVAGSFQLVAGANRLNGAYLTRMPTLRLSFHHNDKKTAMI